MGNIAREMYMSGKVIYYKNRFPVYSQILDRALTELSLEPAYQAFTAAKDFLFFTANLYS
ncbi:hypothetical protein [Listeria floridensis]|nr:hypothetical protein [Listeria floridensis]